MQESRVSDFVPKVDSNKTFFFFLILLLDNCVRVFYNNNCLKKKKKKKKLHFEDMTVLVMGCRPAHAVCIRMTLAD